MSLAFYRPCRQSPDDVFLHKQIEDKDREDRYHRHGHKPGPIHAELAFRAEDLKHDRPFRPCSQENIRRDEIIPDPHRIEDDGGRGDGFHQREDDFKEHPWDAAAIHDRRLLEFPRDRPHIAHGKEHGKRRAIAVKQDHSDPGIDQVKRLHHLKQRQKDRLERHQKADHQINHERVVQLAFAKSDRICRHLPDHDDCQHRADRDEQCVAKRLVDLRVGQDIRIVFQVYFFREPGWVHGHIRHGLEGIDHHIVKGIEEDQADWKQE